MYTTNGKPCILALLALGLTACEAPWGDDADVPAAPWSGIIRTSGERRDFWISC